jgi:hypothetical protein
MLEPEARNLLLDALKPPPGYAFDRAVGTTFTLDLVALLVTPVAFARFDVEGDDGGAMANPVALVEAVRRHARNITIYCQAGEIGLPSVAQGSRSRGVFAYLEASVVQVATPVRDGIFHPKVWLIRYRAPDGDARYRFLCLSRNLTFDRSWDTILRLDGAPGPTNDRNAPLAEFFAALPGLATGKIDDRHLTATMELAEEIRHIDWEPLPDGLMLHRFWPIGHDATPAWPFPSRVQQMLVVSPFAGPDALARFGKASSECFLVSRSETLDGLGRSGTAGFRRTLVLNEDASSPQPADPDEPADTGAQPLAELLGLHAKLYVADVPYRTHIWTGSANATWQAFNRNVEFLVELRAPKVHSGVSVMLEPSPPGRPIALANILEDYVPPIDAVPETTSDQLDASLDSIGRDLASLRYRANVSLAPDDLFAVTLEGSGQPPGQPQGMNLTVQCRPMTLGPVANASLSATETGVVAKFRTSFEALTAFFAVELRAETSSGSGVRQFLIAAELIGAPQDRLERILVNELRNGSDLIRLLLLMLGNVDPAFGGLADLGGGGIVARPDGVSILGSEALLEPLLRALSRDPDRIDEIERLMAELMRAPDGAKLLPPGWDRLWAAIGAARPTATRTRA